MAGSITAFSLWYLQQGRPGILKWWFCGLAITVIWLATGLTATIHHGSGDSFHTLSSPGRSGLALLTIAMVFTLLWLSDLKSRLLIAKTRLPPIPGLIIDLAATLVIFLIWYSLAPQIYYLYYQSIIPGLPNQWVVSKLRLEETTWLLSHSGPLSYSLQSAQLALWWLTGVASLRWFIRTQSNQTDPKSIILPGLTITCCCLGWYLVAAD
jgi:hypothetical protein